ncbi:hypothetical protein Patl1_22046 [Pistacia atlantica]|uniref:Uncharacterized protein n=1 Tax=Pistacia atlantica TaxID=434234 RepID=A0ACC1BNY3_9ROSI|nr:hypothetical protein Patl1_22046 [Pistacia atlantica]
MIMYHGAQGGIGYAVTTSVAIGGLSLGAVGVATNKLPLKWLSSQMGLVSQEPALFATSIMETNIFGKEDATIEEVVGAAKA